MTIVGAAEVVIHAGTAGFAREVEAGTAPGLARLEKESQIAGAASGASLRRGVTAQTGLLAKDLEAHGAQAGASLSRGMGGGVGKLSALLGGLGVPIAGLTARTDSLGRTVGQLEGHSASAAGSLDHFAKVGLLGAAAGFVAAGAAGIHFAGQMQTAEASIAGAAGTSVASADKIGQAFLSTAGHSEFSAIQMAQAFASVAGQLKATEGRALSATQAQTFMSAATELATAKQIDLGSAVSATAGIMQAFQLKTTDAGHVTDVLYQASNATGQSVATLATQVERLRSKLGDTAGSLTSVTGLLVDMTEHGITGRAAMAGVTSGLNALIKSSTGAVAAQQAETAAYGQMNPALKATALELAHGTITATQFKKVLATLPADQAAAGVAFAKSTATVQTATDKYKSLGVSVFDSAGKFVGMRSIIEQLGPRFATMTQQQQLASAATLFGAGAARQMTAVIVAGPAAYDKATAAVGKSGAAHSAAAKQAHTLKVEWDTLKATAIDIATKFGTVLIPVVTRVGGAFLAVTNYAISHKAVLIGLAAVVGGLLTTAIAVFTVNKMAAFGQSFQTAKTAVLDLIAKFPGLSGQLDTVGTKAAATGTKIKAVGDASVAAGGEAATMGSTVSTAGGKVAAYGDTSAVTATKVASVGTAEAALVAEAPAVEGALAAETASFSAMLGPIGLLAAATYGLGQAINAIAPGQSLSTIVAAAGQATAQANRLIGQGANVTAGARAGLSPTALLNSVGSAQVLPWQGGSRVGTYQPTSPAALGQALAPSGAAAIPIPSGTTGSRRTVGSGGGTVPAAPSFTPGGSVKQQILDFFVGKGLTPAQAAGFVGNWQQESGLNPNLTGASGLGLAQWIGGRRTQAEQFAAQQGQPATSLSAQLGFAWHELTGSQSGALAAVRATSTPQQAATAINNLYERPAPATANLAGRQQWAAQALAGYSAGGSGGGVPGASLAQQKTALADQIVNQKAALAKWVADAHASMRGMSADQKAALTAEIIDKKAALSVLINQEKASLGQQSAAQKAELKQQTTDQKAGTTDLNKMLTAIHSGSLKSLDSTLFALNLSHLGRLEAHLSHDHSTALAALSKQLVVVHTQALAALGKAEQAAWATAIGKAMTAQIAAQAATLNAASTLIADNAKNTATAIADQTTVTIDKQAEQGLAGTALVAAQAQTTLDQVTQASDAAIGTAQIAVDNAAGGSALQQAQAAAVLAQANAAATVNEAAAKSVLDIANANAKTTSTPAPSPVPGAQPIVQQSFTIIGSNMSASETLTEIGWAIRTGSLPLVAAHA